MKRIAVLLVAATIVAPAHMALASASVGFERGSAARELPPYLQCVPYARQLTGIQIFGDAHTWWGQAAGKYERGRAPKVGAVMAFQPHRNMRLGHVAAVSKVIDARTVLLDHANWSPINGRRGQIERDVKAVDVSAAGDWSEVRVWYAPQSSLGTSTWPVHGFIYGQKAKLDRVQLAAATPSRAAPVTARAAPKASAPTVVPVRQQPARVVMTQPATPSRSFANAFSGFEKAPVQAVGLRQPVQPARLVASAPQPRPAVRPVTAPQAPRTAPKPRQLDPIDAAIARYGR